ncbi:hypothetical protein MOQ72_37545 [Saccharopolyspora sp. K220]|nr:hypothetical protein [Saccharopolyspora soli]
MNRPAVRGASALDRSVRKPRPKLPDIRFRGSGVEISAMQSLTGRNPVSIQESNVDADGPALAEPSSEFSLAEAEIELDESHLIRGYN